jgi:hypothetical protein
VNNGDTKLDSTGRQAAYTIHQLHLFQIAGISFWLMNAVDYYSPRRPYQQPAEGMDLATIPRCWLVFPPFPGLDRVLLRVSQGDALGWIRAAPLGLVRLEKSKAVPRDGRCFPNSIKGDHNQKQVPGDTNHAEHRGSSCLPSNKTNVAGLDWSLLR